MLELKGIIKDYYVNKNPIHVLKKINLAFPSQQFASILGPSGCGKTTMLNIIGGLDQYTDGDLIINGRSTKDFVDEDWDAYRNKRIGFVFQSYNLIAHLSVVENVEIGMQLAGVNTSERRERALKALKDVGLTGEEHKKVNQLSGGQMQRVAIARSLVNNPDIILADEPTGALDSETSKIVMDILLQISKERLVIVVTHNEKIAEEYSDRIIRMLDGVITSDTLPFNTETSETIVKESNKRTAMSFFTALKSSWKNITTKKGRTMMTSLAASFGIIGVALVLSVSNGFQNYINRVESSTLSIYPIGIYTDAIIFNQNALRPQTDKTPFPSEETVVIRDDNSTANAAMTLKHNILTDSLLTKMNNELVVPGYADNILTNYSFDFHLTGRVTPTSPAKPVGETSYSSFTPIPMGSFHELFGPQEFIEKYYETIGSNSVYPTGPNQVVLVVNRFNQIDKSDLVKLGVIEEDDDVTTSIPFSSIIGRKYKVFSHDEYYKKEASVYKADAYFGTNKEIVQYRSPTAAELNALYDDTSKGRELEVVGVLRIKESAVYADLMPNGIAYTAELKNQMFNDAKNSQIAQQMANNYTIDVNPVVMQAIINTLPADAPRKEATMVIADQTMTFYSPLKGGVDPVEVEPFSFNSNGMTYLDFAKHFGATFENHYFLNLFELILPYPTGAKYRDLTYSPLYSAAIFARDGAGKTSIRNWINDHNAKENKTWNDAGNDGDSPYFIAYSDLVSEITSTLGTLVSVVSIVLIVFSSISLVVSSVMIGIITSASVIERTKEIGVLRAVGARKKDVGRLFLAETFIIGIFAGLIAVGFTYIASIPLNIIFNNQFPEAALGSIADLNPLHALILIVINVILTVMSGLVPSRAAAKKNPVVALRTE